MTQLSLFTDTQLDEAERDFAQREKMLFILEYGMHLDYDTYHQYRHLIPTAIQDKLVHEYPEGLGRMGVYLLCNKR